MRIDDDLKVVLGQIDWTCGLAETCEPYTPTEDEARAAWNKLRGIERLRWGSKLHIVWQDEVDFYIQEFGPDWEKQYEADGDTGYLIALPGARCSCPAEEDSVVWVPAIRCDKEQGLPLWVQLQVLLANPMVAWVEVKG